MTRRRGEAEARGVFICSEGGTNKRSQFSSDKFAQTASPGPPGGPAHLALLDLAANDLPPLLDDVDEEVALLHEFALLAGRVHLGMTGRVTDPYPCPENLDDQTSESECRSQREQAP